MAIFDSLGYARFLRDGGVPPEQAETHAEAARRFMMADLVTKDDLDVQTLRISVRVGIMLAAAVSLLAALMGIMLRLH
ncbi:MAG TPA: hypothetical protein VEK82_15245 [Stellaceae bacterium]|nr:hypothetical protein [Stellaceae bacterium]